MLKLHERRTFARNLLEQFFEEGKRDVLKVAIYIDDIEGFDLIIAGSTEAGSRAQRGKDDGVHGRRKERKNTRRRLATLQYLFSHVSLIHSTSLVILDWERRHRSTALSLVGQGFCAIRTIRRAFGTFGKFNDSRPKSMFSWKNRRLRTEDGAKTERGGVSTSDWFSSAPGLRTGDDHESTQSWNPVSVNCQLIFHAFTCLSEAE